MGVTSPYLTGTHPYQSKLHSSIDYQTSTQSRYSKFWPWLYAVSSRRKRNCVRTQYVVSLVWSMTISCHTNLLKKSWLRNTFQVRRGVVARAWTWLKANNSFYKDIVIDEDRLTSLPQADVPTEITACIRRDDDPLAADRERPGYVLLDDIEGKRSKVSRRRFWQCYIAQQNATVVKAAGQRNGDSTTISPGELHTVEKILISADVEGLRVFAIQMPYRYKPSVY